MKSSSLSSLQRGQLGTIVAIHESGTASKRLADMGFVRGAKVEMVRPGRPCLVRVGGLCVGLGTMHQESITLVTE